MLNPAALSRESAVDRESNKAKWIGITPWVRNFNAETRDGC